MRIFAALSLTALLGLLSSGSEAAGLPLIISATVDYTHNTLTISGQNFGTVSAVRLDSLGFTTQSSTSSQIVANFPSSNLPSSFMPGTYFLTVTFKNQFPTIFGVDIGANGAQGPAGPAGATGAQGSPGPQGVPGPQGLQGVTGSPGAQGLAGVPGSLGAQGLKGDPGPMGPKGADGAIGPAGQNGATGAPGPQGIPGPQGLAGPQGAKGDKGDPGSSSGLVCTTAPNIYLMIAANGAQTCQPRYVDNGDLTVTDNRTGLMWEKKFDGSVPIICSIGDPSCPPDPIHEVNNTYSWSSTGTLADGTLFTTFIPGLNGGDYYSPSAGQTVSSGPGTCFANHCDWRIPSIAELQGILVAPFPCTPCIDPAFGPTQASDYWSSSSVWINPSNAWGAYFGGGRVDSLKGNDSYARAVRSAR